MGRIPRRRSAPVGCPASSGMECPSPSSPLDVPPAHRRYRRRRPAVRADGQAGTLDHIQRPGPEIHLGRLCVRSSAGLGSLMLRSCGALAGQATETSISRRGRFRDTGQTPANACDAHRGPDRPRRLLASRATPGPRAWHACLGVGLIRRTGPGGQVTGPGGRVPPSGAALRSSRLGRPRRQHACDPVTMRRRAIVSADGDSRCATSLGTGPRCPLRTGTGRIPAPLGGRHRPWCRAASAHVVPGSAMATVTRVPTRVTETPAHGGDRWDSAPTCPVVGAERFAATRILCGVGSQEAPRPGDRGPLMDTALRGLTRGAAKGDGEATDPIDPERRKPAGRPSHGSS